MSTFMLITGFRLRGKSVRERDYKDDDLVGLLLDAPKEMELIRGDGRYSYR